MADKCYLSDCKVKSKLIYGNYCYKHRRNYFINEDKIINSRRFTGLSKDYLKDDLLPESISVLRRFDCSISLSKYSTLNHLESILRFCLLQNKGN